MILREVAVLDRHLLGYDLCAFIRIKLTTMEEANIKEFEQKALAMPGVQELQLISTESAYRVRIVVQSIADYEIFFRHHLGRLPFVSEIVANFIVSEPKYTMELPI
ncbi:MAG: Lrp/AsnC family transcriptional regulator [Epibacterium sp.]|nr:Lrp/AsnC family transcriptional regulator [Epibacterium sp.]